MSITNHIMMLLVKRCVQAHQRNEAMIFDEHDFPLIRNLHFTQNGRTYSLIDLISILVKENNDLSQRLEDATK